jgi:hypothetical protein
MGVEEYLLTGLVEGSMLQPIRLKEKISMIFLSNGSAKQKNTFFQTFLGHNVL